MSKPAVDVIMRTGGRPLEVVERAVSSLARQTAGAVRLILVRHGPTDAEAVRVLVRGALREVTIVDAPGANRGRAMAAGLLQVQARWFGFLDDDDYLLEDHYCGLLDAAAGAASPVFAYSDILVEDDSGLRMFREGPAVPPLGQITDRISVHAFLAERAALEGVPFERWGLSTAEDALLVAALLARSTPVHSPRATCVYVQGRADASAYLSHPDRAADELAFAREVAPFRMVIESKFGAAEVVSEASWLVPFEIAARNAALFKRLRNRAAGNEPVAIRDGAETTRVARDMMLATIPNVLAFEPLAGEVQMGAGDGVAIAAGQDYAFAARVALDFPSEARPATVAVRLREVRGVFGLALLGPDGALTAEARVEATPMPLEVQLSWWRAEPPALIVRRLSALEAAQPGLVVEAVDLAFSKAGLAYDDDVVEAQASLEVLASKPRTVRSSALTDELSGKAIEALAAPLTIALGSIPWAYAFSMPLASEVAHSGFRVELSAAKVPVFVLRVDEAWSIVGERLEAPAGGRAVILWLEPLGNQAAASRLVLQAGAAPGDAEVTLRGILLYPET